MARRGIRYQLFILTSKVAISTMVLLSVVYSVYITVFSEGYDEYSWIPSVHDWVLTLISGVLSSVVALGFAWIFARKVIIPLNAVALSARKIAEGQLSERVSHNGGEIFETTLLINDFNSMADKLEIMSNEMKKWNAAIAHELRTPVTVLQGRIQGIRDGVFDASEQEFEILLDQTKGLSRLISDLRVLSLSDSGQLYLYRETLQLDQLIAETVALFEDDFRARSITPVIEAQPLSVFLDKFRFIQVLTALLGNALKYSDAGQLLVTCGMSGDHILITVEDEGPGINAKEATKIFDAFYRTDSSRTNETDGTGLGLAVVSSIIRAHGGSVECRKSRLGGSCLELKIPVISK
ncbi:ATP-binding protein [Citrobacter portucalensis]|nr:ATP-binding protein [Citrobacter portucalensis]MCX8979079.1 ATP-binding protein [Citrobacter portucalensis]